MAKASPKPEYDERALSLIAKLKEATNKAKAIREKPSSDPADRPSAEYVDARLYALPAAVEEAAREFELNSTMPTEQRKKILAQYQVWITEHNSLTSDPKFLESERGKETIDRMFGIVAGLEKSEP